MLIHLKQAVKTYGEGDSLVYALNHANLEVNEGEICVILGPSGSGKSTLLNMLGGLDSLQEGTLEIHNRVVSDMNRKQLLEFRREEIGFIFQFYNLIPDLTVQENIEVAADIAKHPLAIDEVLKALEIEGYRNRFPKELSGGQQQRVAIARAMIKNPKILLCDELTGALDSSSSKEVLQFVEKMNHQYHTTIIIVTHNEVIQKMSDRIIRVKDGKIVSNQLNVTRICAKELEI